ncbi:beta-lactamase family protein [Nonomuraea sp. NBC_01738]|uniref:serine hydrolase domain-containing protein n=1 Tax=Nonomuraea sp. NBC_01738 TaxID=2976003 RepID=UPI002E119611|nr:beta-lactamase family protein [Nonomuraea sp. NBC_01738]
MRRLAALSLATAAVAFGVVAPAQAATGLDRSALREAITVRPDDGAGGVVAQVRGDGETWRGASGDIVTGRRISPDAHFRIGSVSKPMDAVILLQLAAEGRIDLDQSVQHYLPGLLPQDRFPDPITVRQLLNHTSGLPHVFEGAPATSPDEELEQRLDYLTFDQVIQQTLHPAGRPAPGPRFRPGTRQEYNSFGYRIAGKLIEEITRHPYQYEVYSRILRPLKLHQTGVTRPGAATPVPRPYLPGYQTSGDGKLVDVNVQGGLPSSLTSTTADLDRFVTALFDGRLLPPAQTAELFALPTGADGKPLPYADDANCNVGPGKGTACFSVGLKYVPLPDGSLLWGKTGSDPGYRSGVFASRDLTRRVSYSVGTTAPIDGIPMVIQRLAFTAFGG